MIAMLALELFARMTGWHLAEVLTWCSMGLVLAATVRQFGLREAYLLGLCAALSIAIYLGHGDAGAKLTGAMNQASFLMVFVLLLGLLHDAAGTSPSVEALGRYISRQPAQRRFYALFSGTGVMAVLFNLGVASFLVPLIQRGIRASAPGDPLNEIRERRQISALMRGFAWCVIWSPTAIAPLALMELIPGVNRESWILLGLGLFGVFMVIGALEDAIRFRAFRPRADRPPPVFPGHAALMFGLACGWLLGLSYIVSLLLDETIIFSLMVVCPVMLLGWLFVQYRATSDRPLAAMKGRLTEIAYIGLPLSARVAVTLGCSGFIGRAAATLVPADSVATALNLDGIPDFLLLSLVPVAIGAMSFLGLSPIMTAVFFGSFFGQLAVLPADPTLLALSISVGWSISMLISPLATVVLMVNRVGGYPTTTLTLRWNAVYAALSVAALLPVFAVLDAVFG